MRTVLLTASMVSALVLFGTGCALSPKVKYPVFKVEVKDEVRNYSEAEPVKGEIEFDGKTMQYTYIKGALADGTVYRIVFAHLGAGPENAWNGIEVPLAVKYGVSAESSFGREEVPGEKETFAYDLKSGWAAVEFTKPEDVLASGTTTPLAAPVVYWPMRWRFMYIGSLSTGVNSSRYFACAVTGEAAAAMGLGKDQICFADKGSVVSNLKSDPVGQEPKQVPNGYVAVLEEGATEVDIHEAAESDFRGGFMDKARLFMKTVFDKYQ